MQVPFGTVLPHFSRLGVPVLGTAMATPPWYSTIDPHFHFHENCKIGEQIRRVSFWPGDGGKPACPECSRLLVSESRQMPAINSEPRS